MTATKTDLNDIREQATPSQVGVQGISLNQLWDKMLGLDDFLLVMAMDERRYEAAHIAGSVSFDRLTEILPELARDTEIIVYCTNEACAASKLRAAMLVEAGFTNVFRFAGGLAEWVGAGLPIVESGRAA